MDPGEISSYDNVSITANRLRNSIPKTHKFRIQSQVSTYDNVKSSGKDTINGMDRLRKTSHNKLNLLRKQKYEKMKNNSSGQLREIVIDEKQDKSTRVRKNPDGRSAPNVPEKTTKSTAYRKGFLIFEKFLRKKFRRI